MHAYVHVCYVELLFYVKRARTLSFSVFDDEKRPFSRILTDPTCFGHSHTNTSDTVLQNAAEIIEPVFLVVVVVALLNLSISISHRRHTRIRSRKG